MVYFTLLVLSIVFLASAAFPAFLNLRSPPPLPQIDLEEWWGPNSLKAKQDATIRPFTVKFEESMINDLRNRLKNHRPFTPPLEGIAFEYGFNSQQLERWIKYWAEEYPFSEREKIFNKYPQFKTNIQGLDIHFIRVKPDVPQGTEVVPLLLLHGWPGSVQEFQEAIPLLTAVSNDRDFAIEVIVASLPGYGFSDGAVRPGLGADKVAIIFRNLMHRLGYKKYYIQGGDWGSAITANMATFFPEEVLGYHANLVILTSPAIIFSTIIGSFWPSLVVKPELADRMYPLSKIFARYLEEFGSIHLQATKPDTADAVEIFLRNDPFSTGVGLSDSPAGLAAYILEKFSTWTKEENKYLADGGLNFRFTKEHLIDNLMMYWSTNSIITSFRLYSETFNKRYASLNLSEIPSTVPTWVIQAKNELNYLPAWMIRLKFPNLLNETILDDGGHFLALELPKEFSKDVLNAIDAFRKWHKSRAKNWLQ